MEYLQLLGTQNGIKDSWVIGLLINLLGYACVILPGLVVLKYIKASQYLEKSGENLTALWHYLFHLQIHYSEYV